jgi:hypothetical protein
MAIGLMPVSIRGHYGRLPIRNAANWMHRHCFCGAPLIRKGFEQAAWSGFLAPLDEAPTPDQRGNGPKI